MSLLVPGYQRLAEEEQARQATAQRIDCLPWSPDLAAGPIHVLRDAAAAARWAERLHGEPVSMLGVETAFTFDRPAVTLRDGRAVEDVSALQGRVSIRR